MTKVYRIESKNGSGLVSEDNRKEVNNKLMKMFCKHYADMYNSSDSLFEFKREESGNKLEFKDNLINLSIYLFSDSDLIILYEYEPKNEETFKKYYELNSLIMASYEKYYGSEMIVRQLTGSLNK